MDVCKYVQFAICNKLKNTNVNRKLKTRQEIQKYFGAD